MRSLNRPFKLYVGNLGENRKSDLEHLFSKYGEMLSINIHDNNHFAFVEFKSSSEAQRALEHTHKKTINGSKLRVEYAKPSRDNRISLPRHRSPTSIIYSELEVTANRLPPIQVFRQSYYPSTMIAHDSTSRDRSITPPSLIYNSRLSSMQQMQLQDFYSRHSVMHYEPSLMQRLPSTDFFPSTSYPNFDRYTAQPEKRRRRTSAMGQNRSSHKRKKFFTSSPQRGTRTPPPLSTRRSRKRSPSSSNKAASISEQKPSPDLSSKDNEQRSKSKKRSSKNNSSRKTKE